MKLVLITLGLAASQTNRRPAHWRRREARDTFPSLRWGVIQPAMATLTSLKEG
jgi:hypothetical protein